MTLSQADTFRGLCEENQRLQAENASLKALLERLKGVAFEAMYVLEIEGWDTAASNLSAALAATEGTSASNSPA